MKIVNIQYHQLFFNCYKNSIKKIIFLFFIVVSACKNTVKSNLEKILVAKITNGCGINQNFNCTINLKDVTTFKWDRVFLFGSWTMPDSIENAINLKYVGDYVPDDHKRILFLYLGKLAYEEDFATIDYNNSTIDFQNVLDDKIRLKNTYFTPSTAVFKVKKEKIENSSKDCFYYLLTPIR